MPKLNEIQKEVSARVAAEDALIQILQNIRHEASAGDHTMHPCDCGHRQGCRSIKCLDCWIEELSSIVGTTLAAEVAARSRDASYAQHSLQFLHRQCKKILGENNE